MATLKRLAAARCGWVRRLSSYLLLPGSGSVRVADQRAGVSYLPVESATCGVGELLPLPLFASLSHWIFECLG